MIIDRNSIIDWDENITACYDQNTRADATEEHRLEIEKKSQESGKVQSASLAKIVSRILREKFPK